MSRPVPMLAVRGLCAGYGAIEVLHGVDLTVQTGGVLAVLGPNGAGKSTLLRTIAGLHPASGGEVALAGRRVNDADPALLARSGLCLVPEGRGVFPNLTVRDNLRMATYRGVGRSIVEERAFSQFPRLAERADQLAGTMSGGEQQMLALARAVATDPAVLLVDELSTGLAPLVVAELFGVVADLAASGVTVVVVEQFAAVVLGTADFAAVLVDGHVVRTGAPADVEGDLADIYLGRRPTTASAGAPAGAPAGSSAPTAQPHEVTT